MSMNTSTMGRNFCRPADHGETLNVVKSRHAMWVLWRAVDCVLYKQNSFMHGGQGEVASEVAKKGVLEVERR